MHTAETHWLDVSPEETSRIVQELELWHRGEIEDLAKVIAGQREEAELPEIQYGWFDLFCHECGDGDCFQGTIEEAAAHFLPTWAVLNRDRSQAICKACSNAPSTETWASQYEDNRGLLG